jgi:O-methyltransferase involved in polyketide biosynthesis
MAKLTEVSETALITLKSRVIESEKVHPLIQDPVGRDLLEALMGVLPGELGKRILKRNLSPVLTRHIALRARKYDQLCIEFLEEFPEGLLENLGCGFDTRFWRLGGGNLKYIELDLPGVVWIKKQILGEKITYRMLETSILDRAWIELVLKIQAEQVLFIAEGLFMYLPRDPVTDILIQVADSFQSSRLVMEVVTEKYTRGFRRKMVEKKMRKGAGSTAGDYYQYGIKDASDLESYAAGFRVRGEWSFFEDPDLRPSFLQLFKHFKSLSKTQYTVIVDINRPGQDAFI